MKKELKIALISTVLTVGLLGCNNKLDTEENSDLQSVENIEVETKEDITTELYTEVTEIDESSEEESMETETSIAVSYKGDVYLTEDTMTEVLETFFSIKKEDGLEVLETLPLTETFFNECVSDFPYLEEEMYFKEVSFWAMNEENKCICLIKGYDGKVINATNYSYAIEMNIVNNQIDSVEIERIQ